MIEERLYCECCDELIDVKTDRDFRQFKPLYHFIITKDKQYLTSGWMCKRCAKKFEKKLKKLFKEVGFKYIWEEEK